MTEFRCKHPVHSGEGHFNWASSIVVAETPIEAAATFRDEAIEYVRKKNYYGRGKKFASMPLKMQVIGEPFELEVEPTVNVNIPDAD